MGARTRPQGTLFHYLVKKDPEEEATKELFIALDVYCAERNLPRALHGKMQDYLHFQKQQSKAVSDQVVKVRAHCSRSRRCRCQPMPLRLSTRFKWLPGVVASPRRPQTQPLAGASSISASQNRQGSVPVDHQPQ